MTTTTTQYTADTEEQAVHDFALTLAEDLASKPGADVASIYNSTLVKLMHEGFEVGDIPAERFPRMAAERAARMTSDDQLDDEDAGIQDALVDFAEALLAEQDRSDVTVAMVMRKTLSEATCINLGSVGDSHPRLQAALKECNRRWRAARRAEKVQ
ncbi:hypothetical protein Mx9_p10 [Myxococcus phage Mx9]|nr:hypothetical protein Mx9_p10 [Myxococcus phage Mx9]